MSTKMALGGGGGHGHPKYHATLLLTVLTVVFLACLASSGIEGVDDEPQDSELAVDYVVDDDTINITPKQDVQIPTTIYSNYDIQQLEQFFTVTADVTSVAFGELGSKSNLTLDPSDYYITLEPNSDGTYRIVFNVLTLTGTLYQDLTTVEASPVDGTTITVNEGQTPSRIEITDVPNTVYTTTTAEELRDVITVTAFYPDGSSHSVKDYLIEDFDNRMPGECSVSIEYGGLQEHIQIDVEYPYIDTLISVSVMEGVEIYSSYSNSWILNRLDVVGLMTDGKLHSLNDPSELLPGYTFSVSNNLFTDSEKVESGVVEVPITVTSTDGQGGTVSLTDDIPVHQSTPQAVVDVTIPNNTKFTALSGASTDVAIVTVSFTDNQYMPKVVETGYSFSYIPLDDEGNEIKDELTGEVIEYDAIEEIQNDLTAGKYHLKVTYTENGVPVTNMDDPDAPRITIEVERIELLYPSVSGAGESGSQSYNAEYRSWAVSSYTNEAIEAVITCALHTGESATPCDAQMVLGDSGTPIIQAKHVGTYTVTFKIGDEYEKIYELGNPLTGDGTYKLYITEGEPEIYIDSEDLFIWVYGQKDSYGHNMSPPFAARLEGGTQDVTREVPWDQATFEYKKGQQTVSVSSGGEMPMLDAGEWTVTVTVPASANLNGTTSEQLDFKVEPNALTVTLDYSDLKYNGMSQEPKISVSPQSGTDPTIPSDLISTGRDTSKVNADTYTMTFSIDPSVEGNFNFTLSNTSAEWSIDQAQVDYPSITGGKTYNGQAQTWDVLNYIDMVNFGFTVTLNGQDTDDMSLVPDENGYCLSASQSGTYTVTFSLREFETGKTNYEWTDPDKAKGIELTISPATLTPAFSMGESVSLVYGDELKPEHYVESYTGWCEDDGTDDISRVIGTDYTVTSAPGTYYLYITSFESRNYVLSGFDDEGEGLSVLDFTVGKAPLTITSATVGNITYGDPAPSHDAFKLTFKGFRNDEGYYGNNTSRISFTITTDYNPNNSSAGNYPITIDVSEYNQSEGKYTITVDPNFDDVLTVDRRGLTLDWSSEIRNYNAGAAPGFTVMVSGGGEFEGTAHDTPIWKQNGSATSDFQVGDGYSLELTLTEEVAKNYKWVEWTGCDPTILTDGNTMTVGFSITLPQTEFELNITLTDEQRTYGTLSSQLIKDAIGQDGWDLSSITDTDLSGKIDEQMKKGNYTLLFTGNGHSASDGVDEASSLDADKDPYTMILTVGGFTDRYVFAQMELTVLQCQVTVPGIADKTEGTVYNPNGQDVEVTIPDLGDEIKTGNEIVWSFVISGPGDYTNSKTFTGTSGKVDIPVTNSGDYTVTISVSNTEGNYTFDLTDSEFTIHVSKGSITLVFAGSTGYSDEDDMYVGTYNGDAGPDFGIPKAFGDSVELTDVDWLFSYGGESDLDWDGLMDLISDANDDGENYIAGYTVENSNYFGEKTLTFHVDRATLTPTVTVEGGTKADDGSWTLPYDAKEHGVMVTLAGVNDEKITSDVSWSISYTMSDYLNGTSSSGQLTSWDKVVLKDARTYTVTYTPTVKNYEVEEKTIDIEITRAEINYVDLTNGNTKITEGTTSMTYGDVSVLNGVPQADYIAEWTWSFKIDGSSVEGDQWSHLNGEFGMHDQSGGHKYMDRGTYTVSYEVHDAGLNYVPASGTFTIEVELRQLTVSAPEITYGDDPADLNLKELVTGYAKGEGFEDAFPIGKLSVNYSSKDPAGQSKQDGTMYMLSIPETSDNYSLESQSVTFEVNKYSVTVNVGDQGTEYGIIPENGLISQYAEGTTIPYGDDVSKVYTLSLYRDNEESPTSLDVAVKTVDEYRIIGESGNNYAVSFVYTKQGYSVFDVTQRQLTAFIANSYKTFDGKEVTDDDIATVLYLMDGDTRFYGNVVTDVTFYYCGNGEEPGTPESQPMTTNPVNAGYYWVEVTSDLNYDIDDTQLFYQIQRAYYTVNGSPINPSFDANGNTKPYAATDGSFDGYHVVVRVGGILMDDTLVLATGADDSQLTVTYYLRTSEGDEEIDGIPAITQRGTYEIVAKFAGSDNYYPISERIVTFEITQAENHWLDGETLREITMNADGSLPSDYRYPDFQYTLAKIPWTVDATFGYVEIAYYKVEGETQTEITKWDASTMSVGDYKVVLRVDTDENENYQKLETSYTFNISHLHLNPYWDYQQMPYDGDAKENSLKEYDSRFMMVEVQTGSGFDTTNGTMTETDAGSYTILLTLTDPNCLWDVNPDSETISLSWEITNETMANSWAEIPSIRDWTYGMTQSQHYGDAKYGDETFTYYQSDDMDNPLVGKPTDAGDYVMVVEIDDMVIDGITYTGIREEVEFTIHPYRVELPQMVSVDYTGDPIEVPYDDLTKTFYGTEVTVYTVSGESGTEIGDYTAKLTLDDSGNFVWSDGSDHKVVKEVMWRIVSGDTPTYDDFAVDTSDEVYTGKPIEKNVICLRDDWNEGDEYTVTHTGNTNVGTATITVSGTTPATDTDEGTEWTLTFTFEIVPATPVLDFVNDGFTSYEGNGTFQLRPYLSDEADLTDLVWTSDDESVATVDEDGVVTLRGLGTATITATLPASTNWNMVSDSYELTVDEKQTEIVVVPGPGGSGGGGGDGVIYIPTVITKEVDGGISDTTWLIILACSVIVMVVLVWLLWDRRTDGDGE